MLFLAESVSSPGVSNSNFAVGHMSTYKATREQHYDADATMAVLELPINSFCILFPMKSFINYRHIISYRLYVRIK